MKTKKGFMLRSVGDRHIVVAIGKASEEFNGMITLNDSGAFLWKALSEGCTYDELLAKMLEAYEVDEATARDGIDAFLSAARGADLIDEQ